MSAERWLEAVGAVADMARENLALKMRIGLLERTITLQEQEMALLTRAMENARNGTGLPPLSSDRRSP